jgi:hypothetical protein
MNWLIVVVFATMAGDVYIFTDPKFDTKEACMASIKDPQAQVGYIEKLVEEYQRQMPIHMVNCLQEDVINEILEKYPGAPVKEGQAT